MLEGLLCNTAIGSFRRFGMDTLRGGALESLNLLAVEFGSTLEASTGVGMSERAYCLLYCNSGDGGSKDGLFRPTELTGLIGDWLAEKLGVRTTSGMSIVLSCRKG